MPRRARNLPAGSIVHCVNRGNDKRLLFERASEYEDFLDLVEWAKGKCPVRITSYCVMSNHWHFCLWSEVEGDISTFLHRLTTTHAVSWRRRTHTVEHGHVYQNRFKDSHVFTERYYFNLLRYIEQNPARANLVRACRDWRWSSLAERNGNGRNLLIDGPAPLPYEWHKLVEELLPQQDTVDIRKSLRRY